MNHIESPDNSDAGIEREILRKGLTAPRVTPQDIEANIVAEHYFTAAHGVDGHDIEVLRASEPTAPLTLCAMAEDPDLSKTKDMAPLRTLWAVSTTLTANMSATVLSCLMGTTRSFTMESVRAADVLRA